MKISTIVNIIVICAILIPTVNTKAVDTSDWPSIEMSTKNPLLKVGEPLIIELKYVYPTPRISPDSNDIIKKMSHGDVGIVLQIKNSNGEFSSHRVSPPPFTCRDTKGLIYSGYLILFHDSSKKKKLIFDEPGKYTITLFDQEKLEELVGSKAPKPVNVDVKPASELEKKALTLLSGEYDLMILECQDNVPLKNIPGSMDRFKQVIEQCGDIPITKMAAARVGIELYTEFEKQRTQARHERKEIPTQLSKEAYEYLLKGLKLPDAFQIRENLLFMLAESEIEKEDKNYLKAKSYLEEIAVKYPSGRYGKTASNSIKEIEKMMVDDPNRNREAVQLKEEKYSIDHRNNKEK